MSELSTLSARVDRALSGVRFASTVTLSDATGTATLTTTGPAPIRPDAIRRRLDRIMEGAHPGAKLVFAVSGAPGFTLAAPGGAHDGTAETPAPGLPERPTSPSADVRALTPGDILAQPTRGVLVGADGVLEVRTAGTPGEYQTPFAVVAGVALPLRVLGIGPATTAGPIFGLF